MCCSSGEGGGVGLSLMQARLADVNSLVGGGVCTVGGVVKGHHGVWMSQQGL